MTDRGNSAPRNRRSPRRHPGGTGEGNASKGFAGRTPRPPPMDRSPPASACPARHPTLPVSDEERISIPRPTQDPWRQHAGQAPTKSAPARRQGCDGSFRTGHRTRRRPRTPPPPPRPGTRRHRNPDRGGCASMLRPESLARPERGSSATEAWSFPHRSTRRCRKSASLFRTPPHNREPGYTVAQRPEGTQVDFHPDT